jgi:cation/acetate symporter
MPLAKFGEPQPVAITFFILVIIGVLAITYWAARRSRTTEQFYAAGRSIGGFQNGLALAGDYMSAASFLGISGLVALNGFDGMIYSVGWLVGWPIVLVLIAEPLRRLGRYTFVDVVAYRFRQTPVRMAAAFGTITVVIFYLIAQMVGAGTLIKLMFGIDYKAAIIIVGALMITLVLVGGMVATTWVQTIKAALMLGAGAVLVGLTLSKFGFNPLHLFDAAADKLGNKVLAPGSKVVTGPWDAISLGLALMFGTAGLPHILMRFYTVPNLKAARISVGWTTFWVGLFFLFTVVLGFGGMVLVGQGAIKDVDAGGNMTSPMLAQTLGGDAFMGFIAAVAFATILAVVAGLVLAGAGALSHDLWVNVVRRGKAVEKEQLRVARIATLCIGVTAILLGLALEGQNVAFLVGLLFSVAASANFPALVMAIFWRRFTTPGAVTSILVGTVSALTLVVIGPTFWVSVLKNPHPLFNLNNPALVSMSLAFLSGIVVSLLWPERAAYAKFADAEREMILGSGAATPVPFPTLEEPLPTLTK